MNACYLGAWLLRSVDRTMPRHSIYINPLDTMFVLAVKGPETVS